MEWIIFTWTTNRNPTAQSKLRARSSCGCLRSVIRPLVRDIKRWNGSNWLGGQTKIQLSNLIESNIFILKFKKRNQLQNITAQKHSPANNIMLWSVAKENVFDIFRNILIQSRLYWMYKLSVEMCSACIMILQIVLLRFEFTILLAAKWIAANLCLSRLTEWSYFHLIQLAMVVYHFKPIKAPCYKYLDQKNHLTLA